MTSYTNMTTPASIGCEVRTTVDGHESRMQFIVIRDVEGVRFSMYHNGTWSAMSKIVNPERFAPTTPATYAQLKDFAEHFVNAE